jgi:1,4-dihydroxy-2-naphthoyl-CoA hydrolase
MGFIYDRTVRFQDTDAAGVVYFANVLAICHEAYEASLAAAEIDLKAFFGAAEVAVPIAHASVDFLRPMFCGDRLQIHLHPSQTSPSEFQITYQIFATDMAGKPLSKALTRHVCIAPGSRSRLDLPTFLTHWLHLWGKGDS